MASTWSNLKFELIGTGDQSGTWGATTNDNIGLAIEQAIGGKADVTMSSTSETLSLTDTTALQNARALYLNLTGTPGGAATLNVPAVQKAYIVYNNTTGGFAVTVKVSGQTGVSVPNGKTMVLYDNGTDVVDAITHLSSLTLGSALPIASGGTGTTSTTFVNLATNVTGTLPVGNGGTGATTLTANNVILGNGTSAVQFVAPGSTGNVLTSNGTTWTSSAGAAGDVTAAGNNAFTGANTFYNATGQTFAPASTNDGIIVLGRAGGSSSYRVTLAPTTLSTSRTLTLPDATDTVAVLGTAQTFTALQTFSGSTSVAASKLTNAKEVATVSATAATGTINYDVTTQSVLYYTSNASANWTVNFRGSSGTSLNTLMSTGESMTVAFLVTQGSTAYYNSAVQVDGSSVTPKYQGGTAWSAGNASSIDAYVYTIVKTGSATFTVFASQTRFA
jgi:hypothetical protein